MWTDLLFDVLQRFLEVLVYGVSPAAGRRLVDYQSPFTLPPLILLLLLLLLLLRLHLPCVRVHVMGGGR